MKQIPTTAWIVLSSFQSILKRFSDSNGVRGFVRGLMDSGENPIPMLAFRVRSLLDVVLFTNVWKCMLASRNEILETLSMLFVLAVYRNPRTD
jgi:hypothetical protein